MAAAPIIPVVLVNSLAPPPLGTEAHGVFALNASVTLSLQSIIGITSFVWTIRDKPPGSTAALSAPTPTTPFGSTLGPLDEYGSYLVQGVANGDALSVVEFIVAVLTPNRGLRIPAIGETTQWSTSEQWGGSLRDLYIESDAGTQRIAPDSSDLIVWQGADLLNTEGTLGAAGNATTDLRGSGLVTPNMPGFFPGPGERAILITRNDASTGVSANGARLITATNVMYGITTFTVSWWVQYFYLTTFGYFARIEYNGGTFSPLIGMFFDNNNEWPTVAMADNVRVGFTAFQPTTVNKTRWWTNNSRRPVHMGFSHNAATRVLTSWINGKMVGTATAAAGAAELAYTNVNDGKFSFGMNSRGGLGDHQAIECQASDIRVANVVRDQAWWESVWIAGNGY